jgi:2-methylcitrate dehydratase PrpD
MGATSRLAHFASQLRFADIPAAAVSRMKLCILDSIGCAVYAATLPSGQILSDFAVDQGGLADATVWGAEERVPAGMAALVNGSLVHGFELDDLHKESILHPSSAALPAALALAESRDGTTGAELITSCVAGFEIGIRAGRALGTNHLVRGYHPTGTNGVIAAAGSAARTLKLNPRETEHAIGIAATQAAGLMAAQFESMVKRMHAGRAAQSGVYGAQLARRGFTGIDSVFEAEYGGYLSTLSDSPNHAALIAGLGEVYETEKVGFKIYSCCGSCHTSVEAIKQLRRRDGIAADAVESIEVECSRATELHVGWPYEPRSITSAQMNLPYCVAVTLIDGDAFVEQFSAERIHAPDVLDLARRVSVKSAADLDALGPAGRHRVRLRLVLREGGSVSAEVGHAKGSDADPLTSDEVIAKYHRIVAPVRGSAWAEELFDFVMSLEKQPTTTPLSRLLMKSSGQFEKGNSL